MPNAEIFIEKFNKLDHYLEYLLGGFKGSFIEKKDRLKYNTRIKYTVKRYDDDLETINRLRNVVAHERFLDGKPIADPREDVLYKMDEIFEALARPMTVYDRRSKAATLIFSYTEPLSKALRYMKEQDFSQIVVEKGGRYSFLRREDTAVWLENMEQAGKVPSPSEVTIGELMREDVGHKCHIAKDATVYEALTFFQESDQGYPALIITESGREYERPLGVLTPMDLIDYVSIAGPPEY
ncbi:MAG TPA: CBS domain-containing protein [Bacillota bacterium]|nr:CBS domain-containing protein [Bacillota bacterium]HOH10837.1 CBS domain-containing protein [Bacillota bacterium]HOY88625.1 CBS domain-containing protein [Bacillota bacterium]HPI00782.1 CBS domain-containing protein [Bacillota bacterium]HPM63965.1 CBS domain-containing protein [Bacillota bacterium]